MEILADEIMQKVKRRISCSPISKMTSLYGEKFNNEESHENIITKIKNKQKDENIKEERYITSIHQKHHKKNDEKFSQRPSRFESDEKEFYFKSNCKKSLSRKKSVQDFTKSFNKNKSEEKLLVRNILKNIFNEKKNENNINNELFKEKRNIDQSMEIILDTLFNLTSKKIQKMKVMGFSKMKKDSSDFEVKIIIMIRRLQKMIDLYSRCNKVSAFKEFEINLLRNNMRKISSLNFAQKFDRIFLSLRFIYKKRIKDSFKKINMYNLP